ncbi:cinnamate-4-hydroxylase [Actinidia rufa]|uniref:Cinnamate-4-hydroxylase n=1 Tax=Actinidia rufa TaxID=165716 RepID=A0A7J0GRG5_9ERIC|nr:cinnamate-4-hydroxylase [Actinidia rufa]
MDLFLLEKALLGLFLATILAISLSKVRGQRFKLSPGPIPVPAFGNLLQVGDDLNYRNLSDLARKILLLRIGQRNLVFVSSPDIAKDVLRTQGVEFGSPDPKRRVRHLQRKAGTTNPGQDMVFTVYGDHRRKDTADHDRPRLHPQSGPAVPGRVGGRGVSGSGGRADRPGGRGEWDRASEAVVAADVQQHVPDHVLSEVREHGRSTVCEAEGVEWREE